MKKISGFLILCTLVTVFSCFAVNAGSYDSAFNGITFSSLKEFTSTDFDAYQMRGFTATPDGKYLFGGCLQSDKRVVKFNAADGNVLGIYKDSNQGYPKGLAVDDRGYLYVGISVESNNDSVVFSIVEYESMKEVYTSEIKISGKVGINGISTTKIGSKYYMYFVTNYGPNYIYCYDVTDAKNPVLNNSFGVGGIMDIKTVCGDAVEGNYIGINSDGVIFMSGNKGGGSKGDTLFKIAADGKSIIQEAAVSEAYGVSLKDEYVLVSTYAAAASSVVLMNQSDLAKVAEFGQAADATNYTMAVFCGDKIYISDQGFGGSGDRIFVSSAVNIPQATEKPAEEQTSGATTAESSVNTDIQPTTSSQTSPDTGDISILFFIAIIAVSIFAVTRIRRIKQN